MMNLKFSLVFLLVFFSISVNARNIRLSQTNLKQFEEALKTAIHDDVYNIKKLFESIDNENAADEEPPIDDTIKIDVNFNETHNGKLSGNDVLNGLANGNGNENGNNGNGNGNIILQIFNIPFENEQNLVPNTTTTSTTEQTTWWTAAPTTPSSSRI
ncbi:CLUMA_CG020693, isoform A [Clunio marinus]|uniref:CLUMA_CG020693, isoform A n=1 Tax=Clunio marinus TaxID=568069 RepID=A0A1J1J5Q6_9DIPT|nr:CLUMA_CG020693, isoform A [Clunio marinus]